MFDIEGSLDGRLLEVVRNRPTVVFTEALDPRILEAVCHLTRHVRPVLLAPEKEVRYLAKTHMSHVDPDRVEFALAESSFLRVKDQTALLDEFARACLDLEDESVHGGSLEQARARVMDPARFGIYAVRLGHADMVVGGATHAPLDYFRPMLKLLAKRDVVCEAGVFVLPDDEPDSLFPERTVVFADVGVNATMTPEVLAKVAVGTCCVARDLIPMEVLPRIRGAIVSYSNRGSDEGPSPDLVRKAMERVPELLAEQVLADTRYRSIDVTGEVKVSVAVSRRSAAYYGNGQPDDPNEPASVIVSPNLDMGNLLYHLYGVRYPNATKFPVLFGVGSSAVDLAMDTSAPDVRLAVKATTFRLHTSGWTRTPLDTFFKRFRILAINPGSTSTKIALYENDQEVFSREIQHAEDALAPFESRPITDQFAFRKEAILSTLAEHGLGFNDVDAVSARGGLVQPIPHGTYEVNGRMLDDLRAGIQGEHASNLGGLIADDLVAGTGKPAYIVDPVVVDEVPERVRITGLKRIRRRVISHALNQIATARRYAEENETFYERVNVIVAHMGGGITVGAHRRGHYVDVNNGLDGEGPFTPQRSGSLPVGQVIDMCFSGELSQAEIRKLNKGRGGLVDLLGTADFREVEDRVAAGDPDATAVFEAMVYQIAKAITALVPAFDGEPVDRVLLTGGMARCKPLVQRIREFIRPLGCGLTVYPGENEMIALAKGALRVLRGKETAREYAP